ncbi:hypothetical protein ARAF_2655 [Arsenophonus endosymbiont of Aleurodicus floccissimus]|nr:hypothetical protein ARAF_2655 [Arsenophonus endosymbiont of Aleurodicus floccissimus]
MTSVISIRLPDKESEQGPCDFTPSGSQPRYR